jgi:4-amino-4-deoxy-L-arabinose transferase-like glycosyltransferase
MSELAGIRGDPTGRAELFGRRTAAPGWRELARGLASPAAAMPILAVLSGALYLVNLTVSGYANTYYALAAQAGSQSWWAMFFGSLDAQGFVTLDKPPLATWLMGLSVRVFGLSSLSILLPQALLGVATTLVLYLAVRRSFGAAAALIAGVVMAVTPVAVLIFRFDNPDALLTFLLVAAAWALGRGLERGRLGWALVAAALVGTAFLTKFLQAYLVLPAFALVWLASAPVSLRRRVAGLVASAAVVLATSGWWVAIVEAIPAASRPYIGGSTNNSVLDLIFGYDGLGRIFGNHPAGSGLSSGLDGLAGGGGAGPGGASFSGDPGLLRLFNDQLGGEIAWLLPAALVGLAVAAWAVRRAPRTDRRLAGALLWGGWLLVHVAVFSFMSGIIHSYYSVTMAPAIAALVGFGTIELWRRRPAPAARIALAGSIVTTGIVAWLLLARTPTFLPGLGIAVAALSAAAALVLAIPPLEIDRRVVRLGAALALAAGLVGPLAYAGATITSAHSGGDPMAGPAGDGLAGGAGGPGGGVTAAADASLVDYLLANQGAARWLVAVDGSQQAATIQLASGAPVMSMGGFTGGDPTPTLAQFEAYVASGDLRYVLLGGIGGPGGRIAVPNGPAGFGRLGPGARVGGQAAVSSWVISSCARVTIGSATSGLYDCAGAA